MARKRQNFLPINKELRVKTMKTSKPFGFADFLELGDDIRFNAILLQPTQIPVHCLIGLTGPFISPTEVFPDMMRIELEDPFSLCDHLLMLTCLRKNHGAHVADRNRKRINVQ